jgi:hypothetical protein
MLQQKLSGLLQDFGGCPSSIRVVGLDEVTELYKGCKPEPPKFPEA